MRYITIIGIAGVTGATFAPMVALAQSDTLQDFFAIIIRLLNIGAGVIVALAILYFLYGVTQYIMKTGDEGERKKARDTMVWGIIAIFVMVSVWGLVNILQNTFGVEGQRNPDIPGVEIDGRGGSTPSSDPFGGGIDV